MQKGHCFLQRPSRGFSLVEMVAVIVILGVVGSIGAVIMGKGFQAYFMGQDIANSDWQGRLALERITRELRDVRAPADLTGSLGSPDNQLDFKDTAGNSITYSLSGTTLMRNAQPLADGITGLTFTYLRRDGVTSETATAANVYYITVQITVSAPNTNVTYRDTVKPRNFP